VIQLDQKSTCQRRCGRNLKRWGRFPKEEDVRRQERNVEERIKERQKEERKLVEEKSEERREEQKDGKKFINILLIKHS